MNLACDECKTEINPDDNYWHDKKGYFLCETCFISALSQHIEDGFQDIGENIPEVDDDIS